MPCTYLETQQGKGHRGIHSVDTSELIMSMALKNILQKFCGFKISVYLCDVLHYQRAVEPLTINR